MMISSKMVNDYMCCVSNIKHIVSKRPLIQECGKYACTECLDGNQTDEFRCNCCEISHRKLRIPLQPSVLDLFIEKRDQLNELLESKLTHETMIEEKLNTDYFLSKFDEKVDLTIQEIDLRAESLKAKIDEYRQIMVNQLNELRENVRKDFLRINDIHKVRERYKDIVTKTEISDHRFLMQQLEKEIIDLHNQFQAFNFSLSVEDIDMGIIGELRIDLKQKIQYILASGSADNTVKIWDLDTFTCKKTLQGHKNYVCCLTFVKLNILASGSWDGTIKIWNLDTFTCTNTLEGHTSDVRCLTVVKPNILASGSYDNTIKIWNLDTFTCTNTLKGHMNTVLCLTLVKPSILASGSRDQTIKIWNLETFTCTNTLKGHEFYVSCLTLVKPDILVSGSWDTTVKIWNLDTFTCTNTLQGHTGSVSCLTPVKPNILASGSGDKTIKIWNLDSFTCTNTLRAHTWAVNCLTLVMPNILASGSCDTTIKIWNLDTLTCTNTLQGHQSDVKTILGMDN